MSATHRWQRLAALPLTLIIALALVLTTTVSADAAGRNRKLQRAANIAIAQIGDPYNYGSDGPGAFDCSGLTSFAYHKAGLNLPRPPSPPAHHTRRPPQDN